MAIPIIRSDQDILSSVQTYQKPDWILYLSFLTLGYLGTVGVTEVRKTMSVICTVMYFAYFLLMPIYTKYETTKEVPDRL